DCFARRMHSSAKFSNSRALAISQRSSAGAMIPVTSVTSQRAFKSQARSRALSWLVLYPVWWIVGVIVVVRSHELTRLLPPQGQGRSRYFPKLLSSKARGPRPSVEQVHLAAPPSMRAQSPGSPCLVNELRTL